MIQLTYWGLEQYSSAEARGAAAGLVAQSRALLLRNWLPEPHFTGNGSAAGMGSYVPKIPTRTRGSKQHANARKPLRLYTSDQTWNCISKRSVLPRLQVRLRKLRGGRRRRLLVDQLRLPAL